MFSGFETWSFGGFGVTGTIGFEICEKGAERVIRLNLWKTIDTLKNK